MELPNLMQNLTTNISDNTIFKTVGCEIDNVHTDIVWTNFNNCVFLIITQFGKIGSLVLVEKDNVTSVPGQPETSFDVKVLMGSGDIEHQLAGRYLVENLGIDKPLYIFSSLKNYSVETLKALKDICLDRFVC